jgi:hypothetical protein
MLNNYTLWCRQCGATYEEIDKEGVCQKCETPNVLSRHNVIVILPVDAYSIDEARAQVVVLVEDLIADKKLPSNAEVW